MGKNGTKTNIHKYLHESDYSQEPNREWLCNAVNTLVHIEFQDFIKKVAEDRRKELIDS